MINFEDEIRDAVEFRQLDEENREIKSEPKINVISKEEFEDRVDKVFHLLWKTLSKSFGPYGAPTIIYNYPYNHVTKDGYTIMKNLSMDASETYVDQAIADMAGDICGRLNYSVGDGTTSAVIATNSIYQSYQAKRKELENTFILPRDVVRKYEDLKDDILERLSKKIKPVRTSDKKELKENIADVVYISSNADETITSYISDLYEELGAPSISCVLDPDGVTNKSLIEGYKYNLILTDQIYINNDEKTCSLRNVDVIMFSTKITMDTYNYILKPLNTECYRRGRKLLVCGRTYDDTALLKIGNDLKNEFKQRHDVNMVLCGYRAITEHTRKLANDFAILMNTTIIDRSLESMIIDEVTAGNPITKVISMDQRNIPGMKALAYGKQNGENVVCAYIKGEDKLPEGFIPSEEVNELNEEYIPLGFCKNCKIGLKESLFTDFTYNEQLYQAAIEDAKRDLEEKEKKYQKLGTFNIEVAQAQERLYALTLKTGVIGVGGDTELAQKMLKDSVDDAVRAAASAFHHGTVLGCNVNLIQVLTEIYEEAEDETSKILVKILLEGFKDVYRTVLYNAFDDVNIDNLTELDQINGEDTTVIDNLEEVINSKSRTNFNDIFTDKDSLNKAIENIKNRDEKLTVHNVIIEYSLLTNQVFDLGIFNYSTKVINSSQTDGEILKATIDLISLLIVGNQMVVTGKHNF